MFCRRVEKRYRVQEIHVSIVAKKEFLVQFFNGYFSRMRYWPQRWPIHLVLYIKLFAATSFHPYTEKMMLLVIERIFSISLNRSIEIICRWKTKKCINFYKRNYTLGLGAIFFYLAYAYYLCDPRESFFICWLIVLGHEEGLRTRNHLSLLLLSYHIFIRPYASQTLLSLATAKKLMALFTYIISQLMEFEHWMISMELDC